MAAAFLKLMELRAAAPAPGGQDVCSASNAMPRGGRLEKIRKHNTAYDHYPKALRTRISRILGPKVILSFGLGLVRQVGS